MKSTDTVPLCVDLDGTLIRTDLLIESVLGLLRRNVFCLFLLPVWLLRGIAVLKQEIADRVDLDVARLPYHTELVGFLKGESQAGRTLVLTTAANKKYAEQVAAHLELFDQTFASDSLTNLRGETKADALVEMFGDKGFDYAGNSRRDLLVWKRARLAHPVGVSVSLRRDLQALASLGRQSFVVKRVCCSRRSSSW